MGIRITPAVKGMLIAVLATFVIQQSADRFFGGNLGGWLALSAAGFLGEFRFWQLFTYVFLHGDVSHLLLNMLMLAFIGGEIEAPWGAARFLRYFFLCSSVAGLVYLAVVVGLLGGAAYGMPMVGASGGIYGLLLAYGLFYGERQLLLMMLFPIRAKHFVLILAGVELLTTFFSSSAGGALAAVAHLSGMGGGFAALWLKAKWQIWERRRGNGRRAKEILERLAGAGSEARRKARLKKQSHLKLVPGGEKGKDGDDSGSKGSGPSQTWH